MIVGIALSEYLISLVLLCNCSVLKILKHKNMKAQSDSTVTNYIGRNKSTVLLCVHLHFSGFFTVL